MNRATTILAMFLSAATALAQQPPAQEPKPQAKQEAKAPAEPERLDSDFNTNRDFRQKIFQLHHRSPREIFDSISALGSGFRGSAMQMNRDLGTITVRDFPENLTSIEQAISRLDKPTASVDLTVSILVASSAPLKGGSVPESLAPVVRQLKSALRYPNYALVATATNRTAAGEFVRGSGVADLRLIGPPEAKSPFSDFTYQMRAVTVAGTPEQPIAKIDEFTFDMSRVPVSETQQTRANITTSVAIRDKEKVVIGTTTVGDHAVILVLSPTVVP